MLRLKHLFNNRDLAEMLLGNWGSDTEAIDICRISSNAVYSFESKGKEQFLRFSPVTEKYKDNILAELEFITYLRSKQFGVLETVVTKKGMELVEADTPWGEYFASVFNCVTGVKLDKTDLSDNIIWSYGKSLGRLHRLSSEYKPVNNKRWSYRDVLNWIHNTLVDFPRETAALKETELLRDYFDSVPVTKNNFGLIHYDFEYDNVFYDDITQSCNVIDFDDAMYHWFAMDLEQALDSLKDCIPPEMFQQKKQSFMDGYNTEYDISEDMMSLLPGCRRFADLYGYARILRSVNEKWGNEPLWLVSLREQLINAMKRKSLYFGMKI